MSWVAWRCSFRDALSSLPRRRVSSQCNEFVLTCCETSKVTHLIASPHRASLEQNFIAMHSYCPPATSLYPKQHFHLSTTGLSISQTLLTDAGPTVFDSSHFPTWSCAVLVGMSSTYPSLLLVYHSILVPWIPTGCQKACSDSVFTLGNTMAHRASPDSIVLTSMSSDFSCTSRTIHATHRSSYYCSGTYIRKENPENRIK